MTNTSPQNFIIPHRHHTMLSVSLLKEIRLLLVVKCWNIWAVLLKQQRVVNVDTLMINRQLPAYLVTVNSNAYKHQRGETVISDKGQPQPLKAVEPTGKQGVEVFHVNQVSVGWKESIQTRAQR